jgi:NAD(P)H-hydrate epimerase
MFLNREQVRTVDRRAIEEYGMDGLVLMENAGRGAAEVLVSLGIFGPVLVCCGKGNNGGDGLVMARHLANRGMAVRILLFAKPDELTGDAAVNYGIVARSGIALSAHPPPTIDEASIRNELAMADWIVDALFGTGLSGPVRAPLAQVIAAINASRARVLAIDIPSGLDCDTGKPLGPTVRAHHTVTFVAPKMGFSFPHAHEWLGQVHVVDIGVPAVLLDARPAQIE